MGERKRSLLSSSIPALDTQETRASAVETSRPGGTRAGFGNFKKPPQMPGQTISSHCFVPTTDGETGLNLSLEGTPTSPSPIQPKSKHLCCSRWGNVVLPLRRWG